MPKIKKSFLLTIFLTIAMVLSSSIAFAKAQQGQGNGQQQNQEQNQEQNETPLSGNQEQNQEQNATTTKGQITAQEHRSVVANFVQSLLEVADREGGIGQQVRVVAREQNQSASTTIQAMETVQTRSKIKTFLIGSDYKNLGALRSETVQTRNRLEQLTRLAERAENAGDKTELQNQIQTLEQERSRIENFIKAQEGKFSLFGWLVKLFNR